MKLLEFYVSAEDAATNRRLVHIAEGINAELRARQLDEPFRKIVLRLRLPTRKGPRGPAIIDRMLEVERQVEFAQLAAPSREFEAHVFDATDAAMVQASDALAWDATSAREVIATARARERMGLIELSWLRKKLPGRRELRVFHDITETGSRTWAEIRAGAGEAIEIPLRREDVPMVWWASFPGFSARIVAGECIVARKDGREVARITIPPRPDA